MRPIARGIGLVLAAAAGAWIAGELVYSNRPVRTPVRVIQELRIAETSREEYKVVPNYGSVVYAFTEKNPDGTETRAMAPALDDFANIGDEIVVRKSRHSRAVKIPVGDILVPYYPDARATKD